MDLAERVWIVFKSMNRFVPLTPTPTSERWKRHSEQLSILYGDSEWGLFSSFSGPSLSLSYLSGPLFIRDFHVGHLLTPPLQEESFLLLLGGLGLFQGSRWNRDCGWGGIYLISQLSYDRRCYHTLFEGEETEAQRDKQFASSPSLLQIETQGGWVSLLPHAVSRTGRKRKRLAPWLLVVGDRSCWQTTFEVYDIHPQFPYCAFQLLPLLHGCSNHKC